MKKRNLKRKIKIILVVVGGVLLVGGIFWLGVKLGKEKNNSNPSNKKQDNPSDNSETKKELEGKLKQLKEKISKENDFREKKKLEEEKKDLEQKIKNLGGSNSPKSPPSQNPPKTKKTITIKYNTEVGGKHKYINVNDNKKRVLIDTKNKVFSNGGVNLSQKDSQYTISFNEEDATKKGNNFVFDENNDKFQLMPVSKGPSPGPSQNQNNNNPNQKIELEVKWNGGATTSKNSSNNWGFIDSNWPNPRRQFAISKNHPIFKGKKLAHGITPNFKLSFLAKEASDSSINGKEEEWFFDENNQKFTLTPLGNWPDDGSSQGPNQSPSPFTPPRNNNPPLTKQRITLILEFRTLSHTSDSYNFSPRGSKPFKGHSVFVHKNNMAVIGGRPTFIISQEYEITFELSLPEANDFQANADKSVFIKENDFVEIKDIN